MAGVGSTQASSHIIELPDVLSTLPLHSYSQKGLLTNEERQQRRQASKQCRDSVQGR